MLSFGTHTAGDKEMRTAIALTWLFLSIITPVFAADSDSTKNPEPEGYRVISYDAATHQWVILRNGTFDGKYMTKRITVVCKSYYLGNHEAVTGPDACDLQVGNMIIPNPFPRKPQDFIDVIEDSSQVLAITKGYGADRVSQHFKILKYEVLPDK
jgi:hypothetical protein